ncbi:uncharacterized protein LOC126888454 [Diabrotica virgifera virgifera]|uniref:Uncharacterized protein n=1 Tax=Diabrotica virgifera virgifera TaxID=50390 RepID=A0ABM5KRA8_DIAVI|nr:uncharacterized protein LOC126888454 [Diabrotica virgifera virgifera]XP_050512725.1 uncharacterized protein LOC126888454 [Diabrotica virgifera virgifera]XP_050512726.1 uncharacterized protein LOC126888454 [Diabrotica virgifera virgifera]
MELSSGSPNSQDYLKFTKGRRSSSSSYSSYLSEGDIDTIDINSIHFDNDECWLCASNVEDPIVDLDQWLHKDLDSSYSPLANINSHISLHKNVDSRTFTRPKKRFTRPSIERYNEEMYGGSSETITLPSSPRSFVIEENPEFNATLSENSVNFDLSQPSSSYYFEKIVADCGDMDSFQNMSPPSLVNSMCSSTFANLMESSFIKNDPILREIRDTDYSEMVLLQDCEAPMFQSFTESCSSINSDTPENFLKKVSFNGTFKRNTSKDEINKLRSLNATFDACESEKELDKTLKKDSENSSPRNDHTWVNPNGTYRRTPKHNGTFKKSDLKKSHNILNTTFDTDPSPKNNINTTHTLIKDYNGLEDLKKDLSDPIEIHTDLNRLSYCLENEDEKLDATYNDVNRTSNSLKTSTLSGSAGSADSLDRLSSMSSSSRGSNKMLNMADVDAIVEMQERSLQQVMSTPKVATANKRLWENNFISPITAEHTSDSDLSSNDDYKSVRSSVSSKTSLDQYVPKQPKSLGYLHGPAEIKIKTNQKSTYTSAAPKPVPVVRPNPKTNSYSNLRSMNSNLPASYSNIYKMSNPKTQSGNAVSNLKTMGSKLKGSYTSLRPMSSNLPVAPPLISSNTTMTLAKSNSVPHGVDSATRIVEVQPLQREKITIVGDNTFVKPQPVKASGLPRPTGIPRPASRIPAPRSSNVRPNSWSFADSQSEI